MVTTEIKETAHARLQENGSLLKIIQGVIDKITSQSMLPQF